MAVALMSVMPASVAVIVRVVRSAFCGDAQVVSPTPIVTEHNV